MHYDHKHPMRAYPTAERHTFREPAHITEDCRPDDPEGNDVTLSSLQSPDDSQADLHPKAIAMDIHEEEEEVEEAEKGTEARGGWQYGWGGEEEEEEEAGQQVTEAESARAERADGDTPMRAGSTRETGSMDGDLRPHEYAEMAVASADIADDTPLAGMPASQSFDCTTAPWTTPAASSDMDGGQGGYSFRAKISR